MAENCEFSLIYGEATDYNRKATDVAVFGVSITFFQTGDT